MRTDELEAESRSGARPGARAPTTVRILQIFCVTLFVFPSFTVVKVLGAAAFPAGLVGMGAILVWGVWTALGSHDLVSSRTPVRAAFGALWITSLLSYIAMQFRDRSSVEALGADRWLLFLAAMTGIAFLAAECLPSYDALKKVIRALLWGAAFCSAVGVLQYFLSYDLTPVLGRLLPGFTFDGGLGGTQFRSGLNRVPGTTVHPIEFGTIAAMLLPLAVYMAMFDKTTRLRNRLLPLALIGASVPMSVSRSAVVGVAVAFVVFIAGLPLRERLIMLASAPVALGSIFLALPGVFSTLARYFGLGGRDTSIATRIDDYAVVERYVREHPWFGRGGGTYLTTNRLEILDNQYLKWSIEFGLVGLMALLVFFFAVPASAAFIARKRVESVDAKVLSTALAGSIVAAAVVTATFDSLSFPVFAAVYSLLVGLIGAVWRLERIQPAWAAGAAS